MKKIIMFMMAAVLLLGATSCNSCKRKKQTQKVNVEQLVNADYAYMDANHAGFVWYEAQIKLDEYLDESDAPEIASVANVFQYIEDGQPHVVIFTHYADGRCDTSNHEDFWLEDCRIKPSEVKITYNEAYRRLMESNYPKPHSQNCVIRKSVGPYDSNVQYMFGNIEDVLYVDGVTGKVGDTDPAFEPKE